MSTTVNTNPLSTSCQSIASSNGGFSAGSLGTIVVGGTTPAQRSTTQYIYGTGSLGRLKYYHKHKSLDASDDELDYSQLSQSTHIIGRVRSERFLSAKPHEDRRRRTIIVEKKNESYGFTLQSYGIHYKKDQEVEMITYVDYVEYDGPAYKAGMREGDVILSINGTNMEKADHKTIVDFIKGCDARMRMVVLFEDCVRKVELHMRYIQLQNLLHHKMNELERICLRERELLEGKWKTHSLPARKKTTTSPTDGESGISPTDGETQHVTYYRPALSTEDVPSMARQQQSQQPIIPPPAQFTLTYHYLDPTYRYIMKPSTSNSSGEYIVSSTSQGEGLQRSPSDQHFILRHTESFDTATGMASLSQRSAGLSQQRSWGGQPPASHPPVPPPRTCEKHRPPNKQYTMEQQQQQLQQQQQQQTKATTPKTQKSSKHCYGHSCNPCIGHFRWKSAEKAAATAAAASGGLTIAGAGGNGGDNISLEAYDLASPCCDAQCVPTRRRTRHKEHTHKHKHRERERDSKERQPRPKSQTSHTSPGTTRRHVHHHHHHHAAAQDILQQQKLQPHTQPHHHHHHHVSPQQQQHQQQQQQIHASCDSHNGSIHSRYYDLTTGMMSHCSLHSCTSSEFAPADSTSYTTSLSTDTLYWDPKSEPSASRQHSLKSRQSYQQQQPIPQQTHAQQQQHPQHAQQQQQQHQYQQAHHQLPPQQQQPRTNMHGIYQQRYHITATQVQPSQIYPQATYVQKPKSWDNLTTKAVSGYGFGYGYLDTVMVKPAALKLQIAQQRHSIPRKNPYGRYSTYTDVENYAPPPSQFVEELITTTTTTKITAKSTEELVAAPLAQSPCDCMTKQQQQALKAAQYQLNQAGKVAHHNSCQMGYYSHLPRPTIDAATSTVQTTTAGASGDVSTVSEVTRL